MPIDENETALNELFPGAGPEPETFMDIVEDESDTEQPLEPETVELPTEADRLVEELNEPSADAEPEEESEDDIILMFLPSDKFQDAVKIDGVMYAYGFLNGDRVEVPCNTTVELPRKYADLFKAKLEQ